MTNYKLQIKNFKKIPTNHGAAMMMLVIFFMFISLTILIGIVTPTVREFKIAVENLNSKQAYFLAESGSEDALYRIKNGKTISSNEILPPIANFATTTTTTITTINNGQKQIETLSDVSSSQRKVTLSVSTGAGGSFQYGIQSGYGGFVLSGGSTVVGSVYSNGDIDATNGVTITGSAIAANSAAISADQSNITPSPISSCTSSTCITFRNTSTTRDIAQSFTVSTNGPINKVQFYIKKLGAPADATVRIVSDNSGVPSTNNLLSTNGTITAGSVGTSFGLVDVVFSANPQLVAGTTYWLIINNSTQNASNYYVIGANSAYTNGQAKIGAYSGTWNATTPPGLDIYFTVYLGGLTSHVGGGTYVGSVQVGGDAWANQVSGASATGTIYCQTGSNNNKSCNTSRADPTPTSFPISDSNIQTWKDVAVAGTVVTGNVTVGYAGATLGPEKIIGNLTVNGGGTLTLSGTLWVTGTVNVTSGANLKLASTYGGAIGMIIADGIVNLAGGSSTGSGSPGSYFMVLTTSDCPASTSCGGTSALTMTGGAGAIIVNAQKGTLALSGGIHVNEATANRVTVTGGSELDYVSGLSSIYFSNGPTGSWNIQSWKETQ